MRGASIDAPRFLSSNVFFFIKFRYFCSWKSMAVETASLIFNFFIEMTEQSVEKVLLKFYLRFSNFATLKRLEEECR